MLKDIQDLWKKRVAEVLSAQKEDSRSYEWYSGRLNAGRPPDGKMGDVAVPLFSVAQGESPVELTVRVAEALGGAPKGVFAQGPYINIKLDRFSFMRELIKAVEEKKEDWGQGSELSEQNVMIEFSSPNTNKPLHLGHLRNNILGESCSRLLSARGADVCKVNLINDRGVHICKSMLAYKKFADGESPESLGIKSDRFVGDLYVRFCNWAAQDKNAEAAAQAMLQSWEEGDSEVRKLWEKMNDWALSGINATYKRTGISFDIVNRESNTYLLGRDQVMKGLDNDVFYRDKDGSIRLDLQEIGLDTKVLLRSDGTSVYITQDLGTAIHRHEQWPFDQKIYVVGNEQEYHFQVLFFALKKLGFSWASRLKHLSYGMVNLPEGKMKSREGTVVDADDIIDQLVQMAQNEIREKGRENEVGDIFETAESIALAALHYYLLQVSPSKDMVFNPAESLSFNGNTGPYLQYTVARIAGLTAKSSRKDSVEDVNLDLLEREDEWSLCLHVSGFPDLIARAAEKLDPSIVAAGLYEMAKEFSRYYHEVPIARADSPELAAARMKLTEIVLITLKRGFYLLNIPYIESM